MLRTKRRRALAFIGAAAALWLAYHSVTALRRPALQVPARGAVLANVTVINPGRDRREHQTIIVSRDVIERIDDRPPEGRLHPLTRFLERRYVLPGLIDMQVYQPLPFPGLRAALGVYFLAGGVTTVRDVGNFDGDLIATEREIDAGKLAWPRLVACGRVIEGDPPLCARSRIVRDAAGARQAVDELAAAGARCIRVHWTLRADVLGAVRAAAAARDLPVVGDVPLESGLNAAIPDDVSLLTAVPLRAAPRRRGDFLLGWWALDAATREALARPSARQAYTVGLWAWLQLVQAATGAQPPDAFFGLLPRAYRDFIWAAEVSAAAAGVERSEGRQGGLHALRQAIHDLHQAGVRLHGGSGAPGPLVVPGVSVRLELAALSGAMSLEDAWAVFTRNAGEALGTQGLGTIAPGAPADLLLFRDDPTQSIAALATLDAVVSQGRLYVAANLLRSMLDQVRYFDGWAHGWTSSLLARVWSWQQGEELFDCLCP